MKNLRLFVDDLCLWIQSVPDRCIEVAFVNLYTLTQTAFAMVSKSAYW